MAITLDPFGLSMAHTTVSTINESLFVVKKFVVSMLSPYIFAFFCFLFSFFFPVLGRKKVELEGRRRTWS